jgi:hypothetical protein
MVTRAAACPQHEQLRQDGFCIFEGILDGAMLAELRQVTNELLAQQSAVERERYRYQGSNIGIAYQHPVFARLFEWPRALAALAALGFPKPKWSSAFLLSKPPHAPPLYWHQDWWAWDDPYSAGREPAQIFLMYYLTATSPQNGCLRVIPGTHCRRIPFHQILGDAHTDETYDAAPDSPLFSHHPDEVDVIVKAGDLVIGDARLLHAAHANQTDETRTCLTLWYLPNYDALPDSIRAATARQQPLELPHWWQDEAGRLVEPLIPWYEGEAKPAAWNRIPGVHLKA